ncbi:FMN-binding glutamate synthase family protein [Larsenimonas rhizosphaerae]|uniref:FMN-binding glutamate synthase family protein n=1 Tax=Larsenimonas rhizosphaerae TaxID=2944682 RepID=UPI002034A588|nr:FMN-binding glutamate synthase family protein [Larsenimonas rhizosphaerae]MCM2131510.1 FMN-binding glutamate synthase family protein [Larsenimonas rhizosphaerae]
MYQRHFFIALAVSFIGLAITGLFHPAWNVLWVVWLGVAALGIYDLRCHHSVLSNYPVIGHLRYLMEFVRPELRQYFFESDSSGRPFNREQRELINHRAAGGSDAMPFGTLRDIDAAGYDYSMHSLAPKNVDSAFGRVVVGGAQCTKPYNSSIFNISGMSFGALSGNAILAMNKGARAGGFAHDTGEGAISPYHERHGGDLIWQLGTGYFGCRTKEGRFDPDLFKEKACSDQVRMIEVKLSQGAKPSHGGLLPGAKVNDEIAETRRIEAGQDCESPASHPEFSTPGGLLEFVARLRELSGGKPTGFKLCIGQRSEFLSICKAMLDTGILPDFITVDGAEGGTGAAPTEFSDSLGLYINEALPFVHQALTGCGLRDQIRVIASGKVALGYDMVVKHALGADICHAARPFMFAVGCIQSRRCHTNQCPTGVATQDPRRSRALDVEDKSKRVTRYHEATVASFFNMVGAMGLSSPKELTPAMVQHRTQFAPARPWSDIIGPCPAPGQLLDDSERPEAWSACWSAASADRF